MNLLSSEALNEFTTLLPRLTAADVVLFRAGHARLFAAGADMAEMRAFDGWDAMEFARLGQALFASIERLPATTI
jgi:enoyl-CoA hydratase/carnithine racemase